MHFVVASMEAELTELQRELEALEPPRPAGFPVECHVLGVGPRRAGEAMARLLDPSGRRPESVLMLGVAGAVEQGMETGEIVLADRYLLDTQDGDGDPIAPDTGMLDVAGEASLDLRMPVRRSSSLTVDHLIAEGWERQQLRGKYRIASVNMEDHAVASACRDAGVPFLSVRVILDTAEQTLPGYLPGLARRRSALFTQVVLKPWRIPTLVKLKSQMRLCQSVLARFGLSYLDREAARGRNAAEGMPDESVYREHTSAQSQT